MPGAMAGALTVGCVDGEEVRAGVVVPVGSQRLERRHSRDEGAYRLRPVGNALEGRHRPHGSERGKEREECEGSVEQGHGCGSDGGRAAHRPALRHPL